MGKLLGVPVNKYYKQQGFWSSFDALCEGKLFLSSTLILEEIRVYFSLEILVWEVKSDPKKRGPEM